MHREGKGKKGGRGNVGEPGPIGLPIDQILSKLEEDKRNKGNIVDVGPKNSRGIVAPIGNPIPQELTGIEGMEGLRGTPGPNDGGYIHQRLMDAAKEIKRAQELYSQGHYDHSDAKIIDKDDPLRLVMDNLAKLDAKYCYYNNLDPNPELFSTYEPPYEDTIRWSKWPPGPSGIPNKEIDNSSITE